jgi:hypothetical protein
LATPMISPRLPCINPCILTALLFVASRNPDTKTRFATGSGHDGELKSSNHVVRNKFTHPSA